MEGTNNGIVKAYNSVKEYDTTSFGNSNTAEYFPSSLLVRTFVMSLNDIIENSGDKLFVIFF